MLNWSVGFALAWIQPATSPHADAQLVVDRSTVVAGKTVWAALNVELDSGWHIYWKNPGDSGMATDIKWSLNGKPLAGPTEFPTPSALTADGMRVYGYESSATFLIQVAIPKTAKLGQRIRLKADASWLICEKACMPGSAAKTLELTVGKQPKWSSNRAMIDRARQVLPRQMPGWDFAAIAAEKHYLLKVTPPAGTDLAGAQFFSDVPAIIDHSAAAEWTSVGLRVPKSPFASGKVSQLTGLLIAPPGKDWGNGVRGIVVRAPITAAPKDF